ncbi:hypothetical protein CL630_02365 [bacterium]|nr:hypothetical protein [bacterium]|tara:strand:- start:1243 stop:2118 length:876 start_codon:yes stop_codon:yes gene_type:complete
MENAITANPALLRKLQKTGRSEVDIHSFLARKYNTVDCHPVIRKNPFTRNLPKGLTDPSFILTPDQMKYSIMQWLGFSGEFPRIEAMHFACAPTKAIRQAALNVLLSELGVNINVRTGNAEGHRFSHDLVHVRWVEECAEMLGIDTDQLNYWDRVSDKTRRFLTFLEESYGSRNGLVSMGASFAVETWAGHGIGKAEDADSENFWKQELIGLRLFNEMHRVPYGLKPLPERFWALHWAVERGHVVNVDDGLASIFAQPRFDMEKWLEGAQHALDGVYLFFEGREEHRIGRI